jgi:hypothetical protein
MRDKWIREFITVVVTVTVTRMLTPRKLPSGEGEDKPAHEEKYQEASSNV